MTHKLRDRLRSFNSIPVETQRFHQMIRDHSTLMCPKAESLPQHTMPTVVVITGRGQLCSKQKALLVSKKPWLGTIARRKGREFVLISEFPRKLIEMTGKNIDGESWYYRANRLLFAIHWPVLKLKTNKQKQQNNIRYLGLSLPPPSVLKIVNRLRKPEMLTSGFQHSASQRSSQHSQEDKSSWVHRYTPEVYPTGLPHAAGRTVHLQKCKKQAKITQWQFLNISNQLNCKWISRLINSLCKQLLAGKSSLQWPLCH